jgi:hypothetical protein
MSDLFIGSPEHSVELNGVERHDSGDTKIIFGQPGFLPAEIRLFDPPPGLRVFRLAGAEGAGQGVEGGDEFSYRLAGADVDGDGFIDYVANAMHADGFANRVPNAGDVYIFSGKKLSAKVGMLSTDPPLPPVLVQARLLLGDQIVQQANAGQTGLRVFVEGLGLRANSQILINDVAVTSTLFDGPTTGGTPIHVVELDQNLDVRNTAGILLIRARNVTPATELSNTVTAGTLLGPQIDSIAPRRKAAGPVILRINGSGFQVGSTISVVGPDNMAIPLKSGGVESSESARAKIRGVFVPPGIVVRVRIVNTQTGVRSNLISVPLP